MSNLFLDHSARVERQEKVLGAREQAGAQQVSRKYNTRRKRIYELKKGLLVQAAAADRAILTKVMLTTISN